MRTGAYLAAALATLISGVTGGLGFFGIISSAGVSFGRLWPLAIAPVVLAAGVLLLLAGTFLYLARRPQGWGRIVCVVGVPWIGFSAASWLMGQDLHGVTFRPILLGPGLCGATLLLVGAVLLVTDWGRPVGPWKA